MFGLQNYNWINEKVAYLNCVTHSFNVGKKLKFSKYVAIVGYHDEETGAIGRFAKFMIES